MGGIAILLESFLVRSDRSLDCLEAGTDGEDVTLCDVPADQSVAAATGAAHRDDGFDFLAEDEVSGDRLIHSVFPFDDGAGGVRFLGTTAVLTEQLLPRLNPATGNELFASIGPYNALNQLAVVLSEIEPVFFSVVDTVVRLIDLNAGRFVDFAPAQVATSAGTFELAQVFSAQITDQGLLILSVELERANDPQVRPSVLIYDVTGLWLGGVALLADDLVTGATLATDQGDLRLGEVFTTAVNGATGSVVVNSLDFSAGGRDTLLFALGQLPRLLLSRGDPVSTGEEIFNPGIGGVLNDSGEVAEIVRVVDPAQPFVPARALAVVHLADGVTVPLVGDGDPMPGLPGAAVLTPLGITLNDARDGMLEIAFFDAPGALQTGLLRFAVDADGAVDYAGLALQSGNSIVDELGVVRTVALGFGAFTLAPPAAGPDNVGVNVGFDDGSRALVLLAAVAPGMPPPNQPPQFDSEPELTVPAERGYLYAPRVSDPDGDGTTLSIERGPPGMEVVDNFSVEWLPVADDAGEVEVVLRLTDAVGNSVTQAYMLTVIPVPGDADGDGDVDRNDILIILLFRNGPAAGEDDPRDLDGDGTITVLDARLAVLACDLTGCASE